MVDNAGNPAIYGLNGRFYGFWKDYYPDRPYNELDMQSLLMQLENIEEDLPPDFSFIYDDEGLDVDSVKERFESHYQNSGIIQSDKVVPGSKLEAFMDGLNPDWRNIEARNLNPLINVADSVLNTIVTLYNGNNEDAYNAGLRTRPYAEAIANSIVSVGVALTASDLVRMLDEWESRKLSDYDRYAAGQYTRLPSDYYRNPYDPTTYKLQPVYDEAGNLVQGVYTKAFDVNQDIGINDLTSIGYGGSGGGGRYSFDNALKNAIFYASMYGMKQMIFSGKVYDLSGYSAGGYSGVGNVPVTGQPSAFLPPWYYSKNMKLEGWGGWMKSKFGDYLIKKRY